MRNSAAELRALCQLWGPFFRSTMRHCGIGYRNRATESAAGRGFLLDQFQQGTAALALRRSGVVRSFRRHIIRQHCIAQRLQFRISNSMELHSKLENSHRHQFGGFPAGAGQETSPALLKLREN